MANKCIFFGRLVKDVDVRYNDKTQKAVANFSIAVNRDFKNKDGKYDADFFNCVAFDKRGEMIGNSFSKGSKILVWGPMRQEHWEDKEGNNHTAYRLYVDGFDFVDSGAGPAARSNAAGDARPAARAVFDGLGEEVDF